MTRALLPKQSSAMKGTLRESLLGITKGVKASVNYTANLKQSMCYPVDEEQSSKYSLMSREPFRESVLFNYQESGRRNSKGYYWYDNSEETK